METNNNKRCSTFAILFLVVWKFLLLLFFTEYRPRWKITNNL